MGGEVNNVRFENISDDIKEIKEAVNQLLRESHSRAVKCENRFSRLETRTVGLTGALGATLTLVGILIYLILS